MKKLLIMITAALLAVSCTDKKESDDVVSKIIIKTKTVNVEAAGGNYDFDYKIENFSGGSLGADTQEEWVTAEVGESEVFLDIAPNTSEEARTATLTVSYKNAEPVYVIIIQKGKTPEFVNEEMFAIDVTDITTTTATVSIAPKDGHNKTYLYSVVDKKSYDIYGAKAYIEACIKQIEWFIEQSQSTGIPTTVSDYLSRNATVNPAIRLNDDTEYYAVAFDLDVNKKYSGNITLKSFTTRKAQQSPNRFQLQMHGSVLSVTAANDDPYICDVLTKESWSEFDSPREAAQMFVSTMRMYLDWYIKNGSQSEDFASTLDHSGDYIAYAFGYSNADKTGGITTEIEYIEFNYKASAASATITGKGRLSLADGIPALRPIISAE